MASLRVDVHHETAVVVQYLPSLDGSAHEPRDKLAHFHRWVLVRSGWANLSLTCAERRVQVSERELASVSRKQFTHPGEVFTVADVDHPSLSFSFASQGELVLGDPKFGTQFNRFHCTISFSGHHRAVYSVNCMALIFPRCSMSRASSSGIRLFFGRYCRFGFAANIGHDSACRCLKTLVLQVQMGLWNTGLGSLTFGSFGSSFAFRSIRLSRSGSTPEMATPMASRSWTLVRPGQFSTCVASTSPTVLSLAEPCFARPMTFDCQDTCATRAHSIPAAVARS